MDKRGFSTKIIQTDYLKKDAHNSLQMPIYSNAAFEFETAEAMELAFQGKSPDHSYSRISNPTVENYEQRVRSITGALAVTALSSGMAALSNTFLVIAKAGDNIITSSHLFGNTYSFFTSTMAAFGVETRMVDFNNPEEIKSNIDKNTIALFFETITNPQLEIVDIKKLSEIAIENNLLLIADSTLTPPNIFNGANFGVNIEILSGTKIISGGGTSIGGLIIDHGNFNWSNISKLKDHSKKFGPFAFNMKLRKEILRNIGACLSPFNAYFQSLGLETLDLRYERAAQNSCIIAEFLNSNSKIKQVNYSGLANNLSHDLAFCQFGKYPLALLTFNLGSRSECFSFMNALKLIHRATNVYDNRTLIIHPASTIYCDFTPEMRKSVDVADTLIRLSPGIEDCDDIILDIKEALATLN